MISNVTGVAVQQTGAIGIAPIHRLLHFPRCYLHTHKSHPYHQSAESYRCDWPNLTDIS